MHVMANIRYAKKMNAFAARFNDEQKAKLLAVANKLNVPEAEALRMILDAYEQ